MTQNRVAWACMAWVALLMLLAYGVGSTREICYLISAAGVLSALLLWFLLPRSWKSLRSSNIGTGMLNLLRGLYGVFLLHSFLGPVLLSYVHGERFRIFSVLVVSFSSWAIIAKVRSLYTNSLMDSFEHESLP